MLKKGVKIALVLTVVALISLLGFVACSSDDEPVDLITEEATNPATETDEVTATGTTGQITAITREEGSGTRGAFVEIVDITIEGNDNITLEAVVAPGTSVMMTNVAENPLAIGYASTGVALADERVRVLNIDGVEPSVAHRL